MGQPLSIQARRNRTAPVAEKLESRLLLANALIPLTGARDIVFDDTRNILYITTQAGKVERYDVASHSLLSPWFVGTSLNGADITPDGSALYVADAATSGTQGFIRRVELNTGVVSSLEYIRENGETGARDVGIASNGNGFFTTGTTGGGPHSQRLQHDSNPLAGRRDYQKYGGGQCFQRTWSDSQFFGRNG